MAPALEYEALLRKASGDVREQQHSTLKNTFVKNTPSPMKRSAHTQNTPCRPKISPLLGKLPKLNAAALHITQICWELKPWEGYPCLLPKTARFPHHSLAWLAAENKTAHEQKRVTERLEGVFSLSLLYRAAAHVTCNLLPNLFFLFVLFFV